MLIRGVVIAASKDALAGESGTAAQHNGDLKHPAQGLKFRSASYSSGFFAIQGFGDEILASTRRIRQGRFRHGKTSRFDVKDDWHRRNAAGKHSRRCGQGFDVRRRNCMIQRRGGNCNFRRSGGEELTPRHSIGVGFAILQVPDQAQNQALLGIFSSTCIATRVLRSKLFDRWAMDWGNVVGVGELEIPPIFLCYTGAHEPDKSKTIS
jgi:hypothetical protein